MNLKTLFGIVFIILLTIFCFKSAIFLFAAEKGINELAKAMLILGADVNAKNSYGESPVIFASTKKNKKMIRYYIEKGASLDSRGGGPDSRWTLLMAAAKEKDIDMTKYLLDKGADANAKNAKGINALYGTDDIEIARLLIEKGADVNAAAQNGATPLRIAKNIDVIKLLINKGANVNARNDKGVSLLADALEKKEYEKANLLEKAGAKK